MQKLCCEGGNVFSDAQSYAGSYVDYRMLRAICSAVYYGSTLLEYFRAMHYAERYAQSYALSYAPRFRA